jgi:LysM repeat protein
MIIDQLFDNKNKKLNEGLADDIMATAKSLGMNPRLRGTPDEERKRTQDMMKQRAADRANAPKPQPVDDETRAHLQDQLKSLEAKFDPNYEYSDDYGFWKEQSNIAQQIDRIKAALGRGLKENKQSKQRRLMEAQLLEDPVFRTWQGVGRMLAERKLTEPEILDIFKRIETGQTAAGSNRTIAGRAKDATVNAATSVSNAVSGVLNSIQNSAPVAAVDVAYDKATDAVADLTGGQKSKVMQAIKGYRNLVKEYPKTAGFAKAALVAIAGLATSGAGLPAIAGLTYALDSAIRGDKLSSVMGKGAGAAAVTWGGQKVAGMFGDQPGAGLDPSQFPAYDDAGNLMPGWHINPESGQPYWTGELATGADGLAAAPGDGLAAAPMGGGTYTIQNGDQLGYIAQANGVSVEDIRGLNPQIDFAKPLQPGMEIQLPPSGTPGQGSVWSGYQGGMYGDKAAQIREHIYAVKLMKFTDLVNERRTVYRWALNESRGNGMNNSVVLSQQGVLHVIGEVANLQNRLVEYVEAGPGREALPDYYRPDMPGGPGAKSKPGMIGRGLNWLDRAAGKVGGALRSFGHQLTTKVTADKLKMNWHQGGKPTDSDQLAAWLQTQGVNPEVISSVYGELGLPAAAVAQKAEPAGAEKTGYNSNFAPVTDPVTGKRMTQAELKAKYAAKDAVAPATDIDATADTDAEADTADSNAGAGVFNTMAQQLTPTSTGGRITPTSTGIRHTASASNPNIKTAGATPAPAATPTPAPAAKTAAPVDYSKTMPSYATSSPYKITYNMPGAKGTTPAAPAAKTEPTWTGRAPSEPTAKVKATAPVPDMAWAGKKPTAKQAAEYQRAIQAPQLPESLTWSKNWDPSRSLIKKMRQA